MELNEKIKQFAELKAQEKAIKDQLAVLNGEIVQELETKGETKYQVDDLAVTVTYKTTFKYKDESGLISILKADDELKRYVVEAIDSKGLNDLIKKSESVATKLQESYTKTVSSSLTIK